MLVGEDLIAAETNYNEMKARVEAMGPVNMMALEEFKECEEREAFLRRERDDLVQSIQNTQLTINELDQVSRQKFEEAFNFINAHFAIAFQSLFGGGTAKCGWASRTVQAKRALISWRSRRQAPAEYFAAFWRREGADGFGAVDCGVPVSAQPVLHSRRGGCAAGRGERRAI